MKSFFYMTLFFSLFLTLLSDDERDKVSEKGNPISVYIGHNIRGGKIEKQYKEDPPKREDPHTFFGNSFLFSKNFFRVCSFSLIAGSIFLYVKKLEEYDKDCADFFEKYGITFLMLIPIVDLRDLIEKRGINEMVRIMQWREMDDPIYFFGDVLLHYYRLKRSVWVFKIVPFVNFIWKNIGMFLEEDNRIEEYMTFLLEVIAEEVIKGYHVQ